MAHSIDDANDESKRSLKPVLPIDLNQPGRVRVNDFARLLRIGVSTLWLGIKTGRFPPPDGKDGKLTYWDTATVRKFLESCGG